MAKIALIIILLSLVAAGCQGVELKREQPYSPKESYDQLPR
jgi:hypothetical protein